MNKNKVLAIVLALTLVFASTSFVNADDMNSVVTGMFDATVINVTVSSNVTLQYDPNATAPEDILTADDIHVDNNGTSPIAVAIKSIDVDAGSTWQPTLVAPNAHADWTKLTKAETNAEVALGLNWDTDPNWLSVNPGTSYSTGLSSPVKLGAINPESSVIAKPTVIAGTAFDNAKTLTANYLFEITLE